jgi:hypothetical protein
MSIWARLRPRNGAPSSLKIRDHAVPPVRLEQAAIGRTVGLSDVVAPIAAGEPAPR